jgi:hypothetical protein
MVQCHCLYSRLYSMVRIGLLTSINTLTFCLEIPHETEKPLEELREHRDYLVDQSRYDLLQKEEEELQKKTRWLWYEFTPYEVGCDELGVSHLVVE